VNEKDFADPEAKIDRPCLTVEDWRMFADSVRDLDDPVVMARAWE